MAAFRSSAICSSALSCIPWKEASHAASIAASAGLTIAKGVVGILTGSLAILSEAAHSMLDLVATDHVPDRLAVEKRWTGQPFTGIAYEVQGDRVVANYQVTDGVRLLRAVHVAE